MKKLLFLIAFIFLVTHEASAAFRLYFVPVVTTTRTAFPSKGPKYFSDVAFTARYSVVYYGLEDLALVGCDVTTAQHNALFAQSDVVSVPQNLDANLSAGQVTAVQTFLEARNLPANWVTTSMNPRFVLRKVHWIMQLASHLRGKGFNLFGGGVTLSTMFASLSAPVRSALVATANDMNLDTTGVTNGMTLRAILKLLADQNDTFQIRFTDGRL